MIVGIPTIMKAPPMPKINLPRSAVAKVLAKAVVKLPAATTRVDAKPIRRNPYLLTTKPTGMARNIPGITGIDMSKPAWASLTPKTAPTVGRRGGIVWKTKAKATKAKKDANKTSQR
jgi:hypothetical protein